MSTWNKMDCAPKDGSTILVTLAYRDGSRVDRPMAIYWDDEKGWLAAGFDFVICDTGDESDDLIPQLWERTPLLPWEMEPKW